MYSFKPALVRVGPPARTLMGLVELMVKRETIVSNVLIFRCQNVISPLKAKGEPKFHTLDKENVAFH